MKKHTTVQKREMEYVKSLKKTMYLIYTVVHTVFYWHVV